MGVSKQKHRSSKTMLSIHYYLVSNNISANSAKTTARLSIVSPSSMIN